MAEEGGRGVRLLGAALGLLHLTHNPLHTRLQALARLGRARLDLPSAVTNCVQVQTGGDLRGGTPQRVNSRAGGHWQPASSRTSAAGSALNKSCLLAKTNRGTPASLSSSLINSFNSLLTSSNRAVSALSIT